MSISIEPTVPTTETPITLTFIGGSGCPDPVQTIDGSEFIFEVNNRPSGPCLSAPVPYEFLWTVGPLEAGEYRVTHINPPTQIVESQSFLVVESSAAGGPAPIPTTGAIGALVLAVALALVASRVLRRGRVTGR
ncbi:MAG: hypothetical protein ACNS61_15390 [Candidatus Wenzhouxiangella sp. M2_3B_020]